MRGLIQKSGYIKPGGSGAGNYMKYIATRDGVELYCGDGPVTEKQQRLIADLLRDFPDADSLPEYKDYTDAPTASSASAFISAALDENAHALHESDKYMRYIATRPRVEKHGEHGLFGSVLDVSLEDSMREVSKHPGPVWTFIYSLKREDAARLGYDSAESWRRLIMAHQVELAEAMKIPPSRFRWCAAFHDESHHPHIHMMVWSDDPKQGYLTEDGIEKMRSKLTNDIFRDELLSLYQQKDISYKEVTQSARAAMRELIRQMESSICDSPVIAKEMEKLAEILNDSNSKKYGYLKKPVKAQVDLIVDELARLPEVAECYEAWNRLRDEVESYYKDKPREHLPLSQQKEFRAIKNMVIQEAEYIRLGVVTFEDEGMEDEIEEESDVAFSAPQTMWQMAEEYREAKAVLYGDTTETEKEEAVSELVQLWKKGFTVAAHQLGKCWRDGLGVLPDDEKAELWFRRSAEAENDFSQYALGKLLQSEKRITEAVDWYKRAAEHGNQYAAYRLGKLCLQGMDAPKDVDKAVAYLTVSANQGNQYAQYTLGKLYLMGQDVEQNREAAWDWFSRSAAQGNEYAQFFLDHFDQQRKPSVLLSATRLLHHMGQIFRQNSVPPAAPSGLRVDRKLRRQIREKKIAMGHKEDDHEDQNWGNLTMQ